MLQRTASSLGVLVLAAACGGYAGSRTPSGPSEPPASTPPPAPPQQTVPQVGGAWTGTHEMLFDGTRAESDISLTLTQADRELTGSWRLTSPGWDIRGDVTGTIDGGGDTARFTGSTTVVAQSASGGGRCAGVAEMNSEGALSARSMRWVGPHVRFTVCQTSISALVWRLVR